MQLLLCNHITEKNKVKLSLFDKAFVCSYSFVDIFVRPHLDYADMIYDKPGNINFESKLERVQYNTCLAITGPVQVNNRGSIYAELDVE